MQRWCTLVAAILVGTLGTASTASASVDSTEALRDLASEAADLVSEEQALLTLVKLTEPGSDGTTDASTRAQLRAVDAQGRSLLTQLEQFRVQVSPAVRSALEPLPRQPDSSGRLATDIAPPDVVYAAARTDLLRIAATPDAVAPVADDDTSLSLGLLIVAAVSLVILGLAALANALRRRDSDAELAALAWSDGLTGLANQRRLERDLASFRGTESPTAAIMVDVDHFESVNATHGRRVGDDVLRQVATMLTHHVRFDDVVYRCGREEFCILLPDSSIDDARAVASRIVEAARAIALPDDSNVTVSVGVAEGATDVAEVVATADLALSAAKQSGHDCAVTATADELTSVRRA